MGPNLGADDLECILAAQTVLLSPLSSEDPVAWQLRANRAVRAAARADHAAFSLPTEGKVPVVTDDTETWLPERLDDFLWSDEGTIDPLVVEAHLKRLRGGTGLYHLEDLVPRDALEDSVAYREVFEPAGFIYMIGFSTPVPAGEGTQFLGFEREDAYGYSPEGFERLRLLVPAFEAGVRMQLEFMERWAAFGALLDRLGRAVAVYCVDGALLHRSTGLLEMLEGEPESRALESAADALAAGLRSRWHAAKKSVGQPAPLPAGDLVRTAAAAYRLTGTYLPEGVPGRPAVAVLVDRVWPVAPAPEDLEGRFGLTRREAQVASLMAEGRSDMAISRELGISRHTARTHSERVLRKLGIHSRAAVALRLLEPRGLEECGTPPKPASGTSST